MPGIASLVGAFQRRPGHQLDAAAIGCGAAAEPPREAVGAIGPAQELGGEDLRYQVKQAARQACDELSRCKGVWRGGRNGIGPAGLVQRQGLPGEVALGELVPQLAAVPGVADSDDAKPRVKDRREPVHWSRRGGVQPVTWMAAPADASA